MTEPRIVVEVAGLTASLPVRDVREIVPVRELTRVPGASLPILGLFSHRGSVVPLVDAGHRLGVCGVGSKAGTAVLVNSSVGVLGLVVERIVEFAFTTPPDLPPLDIETLVRDCRAATSELRGTP